MNAGALPAVLVVSTLLGLPACRKKNATTAPDPFREAYDVEQDWNDPQHVIPLNYQQAQGKRLFYKTCVWCHSDSTPAGPSNRNNLATPPPLFNDGATCNSLSDDFMQSIITLGGSAMGKSPIMPPWGKTLAQEEIRAIIAYARAIAQPPYRPPARPGPRYSTK